MADPRDSIDQFLPRYDAAGLVTAIVVDADSRALLMVAHMNDEAIRLTRETGLAHFWSRSRSALWRKGETSGNGLAMVEMRVDCDQDAVWIKVEQIGPGACHTGRRSCFYRAIPLKQSGVVTMEFRDAGQAFDPASTYRGKS